MVRNYGVVVANYNPTMKSGLCREGRRDLMVWSRLVSKPSEFLVKSQQDLQAGFRERERRTKTTPQPH